MPPSPPPPHTLCFLLTTATIIIIIVTTTTTTASQNSLSICHPSIEWQAQTTTTTSTTKWSASRFNWNIARLPTVHDIVTIATTPAVLLTNRTQQNVYTVSFSAAGKLLINDSSVLMSNVSVCAVAGQPDPVRTPAFIDAAVTTTTMVVTFTVPRANGAPITAITVHFWPGCAANASNTTSPATVIAPSCLTPGGVYNVTLTATNVYGTSLPSATIVYHHRLQPTPPATVNVSMVTLDTMLVNWTAPVSNGGVNVQSYHVYVDNVLTATTNGSEYHKYLPVARGRQYVITMTATTAFATSNRTTVTLSAKVYSGPVVTSMGALSSPSPSLTCANAYTLGLITSTTSTNLTINSTAAGSSWLVIYGKQLRVQDASVLRVSIGVYNGTVVKCWSDAFVAVESANGVGANLPVNVYVNEVVANTNLQYRASYPAPMLTPFTFKSYGRSVDILNGRAVVTATGLGDIVEIFGHHFGTIESQVTVMFGLNDGFDDTRFKPSSPAPRTCVIRQAEDVTDTRIRCYVPSFNEVPEYRGIEYAMLRVQVGNQQTSLPSTDRLTFPTAPQITAISGCCSCDDGGGGSGNATSICACPTNGGNGGGMIITLYGSALGTPTAPPVITVGGNNCAGPVSTGTQNVGVTANALTTISSTIHVTYGLPVITQVTGSNCTSGNEGCPRDGFSYVTLVGENFGASGATVLINNQQCTGVKHSTPRPHNELTCRLPAGTGARLPVLLIQGGGFVSSSDAVNSSTCAAGNTPVATVSYQPCPSGTQANGTACDDCVRGKFSSSLTSQQCQVCGGGTFANTTRLSKCFECAAGYVSVFGGGGASGGASSCSACSPGYSQASPGRTVCDACSVGLFAAEYGATVCERCTVGVPVQETGSKSCQNCTSPLFRVDELATACSSCSVGTYFTSSSCDLCPSHFVCSNGEAFVNDGYWRYSTATTAAAAVAAIQCPIESYCVSGKCASGRRQPAASNPLCGECADGLYEWGEACVRCDDGVNGGLIFVALFISLLLVMFVLILSQVESGHWRIFIFFVQTSLLSVNSGSGSSSGSSWTAPLQLLNSDWLSFTGQTCVAPLQPRTRVFLEMLVTLATFVELLIVMVSVALGWMLCPRYASAADDANTRARVTSQDVGHMPWQVETSLTSRQSLAMDGDTKRSTATSVASSVADTEIEVVAAAAASSPSASVSSSSPPPLGNKLLDLFRPVHFSVAPFVRAGIALFFFNYNSIVRHAFSVLDCVQLHDGTSRMRSMPSVQCGSDAYYQGTLLPTAVILLIVMAGIVPGLFVYKLSRARRRGKLDKLKFLRFWGVLTEPYKHNAWYFALVHITRRTLLVAVAVFTPQDSRLAALAICTFVVLLHHTYTEPFGFQNSNTWETVSLSALVVLPMLLATMHEPRNTGENVVAALYTLGVAVVLFVRTLMVKIRVYVARKKKRARGGGGGGHHHKTSSMTSSFDDEEDDGDLVAMAEVRGSVGGVDARMSGEGVELANRRRSLVNRAVANNNRSTASNIVDLPRVMEVEEDVEDESGDVDLPAGWRVFYTEEDNHVPYYVHSGKNITQWERPSSQ